MIINTESNISRETSMDDSPSMIVGEKVGMRIVISGCRVTQSVIAIFLFYSASMILWNWIENRQLKKGK